MKPRTRARLGKAADELDQRYHPAASLRSVFNKVFPTHFSFLLGEIALYSFVVLLLSGTYLALFFDPSLADTTYHGVFTNLRGVDMSKAYESAVDLSFQVRGGLFVRQLHHWAALVFLAAICLHLFRIFFTGAFRKPREGNWIIGMVILVLAAVEGFAGYCLPDDLLSGTSLRIMSSIASSIPVIGTWLQWLVFGSEYPGTIIISRLFTAHILLIPAVILGLIAVHLAFVWFQKHTQFPGRGHAEHTVTGTRTMPVFALHSGTLFLSVTGVLALLGGLAQINPVFNYGPYVSSYVSNGDQPDWYLGFVDGAVRLWPPTPIQLGPYLVPSAFWPGVVMPLVFTLMLISYPFLERKFTRDHREHNLLQRPRDNPVRTGLGWALITYYFWLLLAGGEDIIGLRLDIPVEQLVWMGRVGVFVLPPLAYWIAYRICLRLQRYDRDVLDHGLATGVIIRRPGGDFVEIRQAVSTDDELSGHQPALVASTHPAAPAVQNVSRHDG